MSGGGSVRRTVGRRLLGNRLRWLVLSGCHGHYGRCGVTDNLGENEPSRQGRAEVLKGETKGMDETVRRVASWGFTVSPEEGRGEWEVDLFGEWSKMTAEWRREGRIGLMVAKGYIFLFWLLLMALLICLFTCYVLCVFVSLHIGVEGQRGVNSARDKDLSSANYYCASLYVRIITVILIGICCLCIICHLFSIEESWVPQHNTSPASR